MPPAALVADANVILSALIGGRARLIFTDSRAPRCIATDTVASEVMEYLPELAARRGLRADVLRAALAAMPVDWQPLGSYAAFREDALDRIGQRDPDDWPTLALALALGLPVWSQDRDFEQVGVRVYTTGELLDILR